MRGSHRNTFHPGGNSAIVRSTPRYSRNIHTHTREKPADSAGFPPSPSQCTPLLCPARLRRRRLSPKLPVSPTFTRVLILAETLNFFVMHCICQFVQ